MKKGFDGLLRRKGRRSKTKVNCHHHVLHVSHLGHFLHVPHGGHLHVITYPLCYCFLSNLYNSRLIGQLSSSRSARRPLGSLF